MAGIFSAKQVFLTKAIFQLSLAKENAALLKIRWLMEDAINE
jgi:hypothetical protein